MTKLTALAMLAALIASTPVSADTVREAAVAGELQQFTTDGKVTACGVTISAVELMKTLPKPQEKVLAFSGSFMLYTPSGGLLKGRTNEVRGSDILAGKPILKAREMVAYWLKAPGAPATTPAPGQQMQSSDDPGYSIYVTELKPLSGLIEAVLAQQPIQIGIRLKGSSYASVLFGVVKMNDQEREQFAACLGEWAEGQGLSRAVSESSSPAASQLR